MRQRILVWAIVGILAGYGYAEQKPSEDLGAIEITGEATDKVIIEKTSPQIKIEIKDIIDSVTDKTEKLLDKGKAVPSDDDFNQFDTLSSNQVVQPWLGEFNEPPLVSFYPAISQTTVKEWRLEITDEEGNIIQTVKGRGNPVKRIIWDGLDSRGKIIKVAKNYSYRFIAVDEFKVSHTTLGKAFNLTNIKYKDRKNLYLEISNDFFFDEYQIKAEARDLFGEVLNVLREYSKYPFIVDFVSTDPQGNLIKKRQNTITNDIAQAMLLLPEDVRYSYAKIGERGDVIRFVIQLKKL